MCTRPFTYKMTLEISFHMLQGHSFYRETFMGVAMIAFLAWTFSQVVAL